MAVLKYESTRLIGLLALSFMLAGCFAGEAERGPFSGRVVDAETGAPLPGVHVLVTWAHKGFTLTGDGARSNFDARETVTDANGRFSFPRSDRSWKSGVEAPEFGFFAQGYKTIAEEVSPPNGRLFLDPTVVKMQRVNLECHQMPIPFTSVPDESIPNLDKAIRAWREECRAQRDSQ